MLLKYNYIELFLLRFMQVNSSRSIINLYEL